MPITLHASPLSTASQRVALILHELHIPFDLVPVDMARNAHKSAEHLVNQPFGQVPFLVDDDPLTDVIPLFVAPATTTTATTEGTDNATTTATTTTEEGATEAPTPAATEAPAPATDEATPGAAEVTPAAEAQVTPAAEAQATPAPAPAADPQAEPPATPPFPSSRPPTPPTEPKEPLTIYESRAITRYLALKHLYTTSSAKPSSQSGAESGAGVGSGVRGEGEGNGQQVFGSRTVVPLVPSPGDLGKWTAFEVASSVEVANFEMFAGRIGFEKVYKPRVGQEPDLAAYEAAHAQLGAKLDVYDKILASQAYLAGDTPTLADLHHLPLAARLFPAGAGDLIEARPNVKRWYEALEGRGAWRGVRNGVQSWGGEGEE
ncbi:glutathione S-transferase [Ephemerocybe angulata]|uniref:glutathione transferase n=1 Tax=Ephemerocybe angulata TaxID=980116 RepID=A0A8H6HZV8_9AGAR|nr:glutathione S-transferase [Tulosesus angulatus]